MLNCKVCPQYYLQTVKVKNFMNYMFHKVSAREAVNQKKMDN